MADDFVDVRVRVPRGARVTRVSWDRSGPYSESHGSATIIGQTSAEPEPSDDLVLVTMKVLREETAATDARMDRLSGIITEMDKRLNDLEIARAWIDTKSVYARMQGFEAMLTGVSGFDMRLKDANAAIRRECGEREAQLTEVLERLDRYGIELGTKAAGERVDGVEKRIGRILDYFNLCVGDYGRVRPKEGTVPLAKRVGTIQDRVAELEQRFDRVCIQQASTPTKRTIKGGWLNVWAMDHDRRVSPSLAASKEEADRWARRDEGTRIACIQIPDITEGEGL